MIPPSEAELALLKLFWRQAPLSAREVQNDLPAELGWALSTTRTVLERMRAKGLLTRKTFHGTAVYAPAQSKVFVLAASLRRVFRQVMEVHGELPATAFAGSRILKPEELAELEAMLNAEPTQTPASAQPMPEGEA